MKNKTDTSALAGVSNDSIIKATGKPWQEWISFLDKNKAEKLSHKEIVALLSGMIQKSWWCQKIANAYEVKKGHRVTGQTANSTFQIGVTRTVNIDKDRLWDVISSERGMNVWLGKINGLEGDKKFETEDGIRGEVTVIRHGSHFRLFWQPKRWKDKSTLQVRAIPKKEKSVLSFHQEGLPNARERENMRDYWKEKVEALVKLIEKA